MTSNMKSMNMKHVITALTLALTLLLLAQGAWSPDSFLMSFANVGVQDTVLRSLACVGLVIILASRPPRSMRMRYVLGALSTIILSGACVSMVDYHIGILDAALYVQASIILAMEAIETQTAPVRFARSSATN